MSKVNTNPPPFFTACPFDQGPTNNELPLLRDTRCFSESLWDPLEVLQRWEQNGPLGKGQQDGLTLELSAHSPRDAIHLFQHDAGLQSDYPFLADDSV